MTTKQTNKAKQRREEKLRTEELLREILKSFQAIEKRLNEPLNIRIVEDIKYKIN